MPPAVLATIISCYGYARRHVQYNGIRQAVTLRRCRGIMVRDAAAAG